MVSVMTAKTARDSPAEISTVGLRSVHVAQAGHCCCWEMRLTVEVHLLLLSESL